MTREWTTRSTAIESGATQDQSYARQTSYTYDANGNRVSERTGLSSTKYQYTDGDKLAQVSEAGRTVSFGYDGLGRALASSTTSLLILGQASTQVWDGFEVVHQSGPFGDTSLVRDVTGDVAIQTGDGLLSGGDRWGLTDRLGSTIGQTSGSRIMQVASYTDWGIPTFATPGWNSTTGYTGELTDTVAGLNHYYARTYEPTSGAWLQADPYRGNLTDPGTLARYAYVEGNPTTLQDYYGYATSRARIDYDRPPGRTLPSGPRGRGGPEKPGPEGPGRYKGLDTERHLTTCGTAGTPSCGTGTEPYCSDMTLATFKPVGCQLDFRDETIRNKQLDLLLFLIPGGLLGRLLGKVPGLLGKIPPLFKGPETPPRNPTPSPPTSSPKKGPKSDQAPSSLSEQLAMQEARSNPGEQIIDNLGDAPRLIANYGPGEWVKMRWVHRGEDGSVTVVHYFENLSTGQRVEYKFK